MSELFREYEPTRRLRSQKEKLLMIIKSRSQYGQRAFSVAAPRNWNSLPLGVRRSETEPMVRKKLKTYLFRQFCSA